MGNRQNISSNSPYEPVYGYSRAVKVGNLVFVSGSGAWGEDAEFVGVDDVYAQAKQTIRNIEKALAEAGATLADVVRTRTFITDIARFDEMARAHKEAFGEIRPAATCLQVSALARPDMLVEIEADAVVGGG